MSDSKMPWIKLFTEVLDDPKLGRLPVAIRWRFVEFLLLAGECDAEGYLIVGEGPMTLEDIAWRLRTDPEALRSDMEELLKAGLISIDKETWFVTKFSERQGRSQAEKRIQWRERKRHQRQRETETGEKTEPREDNSGSHGNVTGDTSVTPKGHQGESRECHLLEERREEEESINGAKAPSHISMTSKDRWEFRKRLTAFFCGRTQLPVPRTSTEPERKSAQRLWWSPWDEIIDLAGGNPEEAEGIIGGALEKLGDLTVTDPHSIIRTARQVYAGRKKTGLETSLTANSDGSVYV